MDSASIAWWLRPQVAVTINYGQLAGAAELAASKALCSRLSIEHHTIHVDLRALGSGDMAGREQNKHAPDSDWWPYRNQLLVTLAATKVISLSVQRLLIGTVASDGSHTDGSKAFVAACNDLLQLQEGNLQLEAPAIDMTTVQLVRRSGIPRDVLAWAHSCHRADVNCGQCRGCNKYFSVFQEIGFGMD